MIGNDCQIEEAKELGVTSLSLEELKALAQDKQMVKKWARKVDAIFADESYMRQIPKIVGTSLIKVRRFPYAVRKNEKIEDKIKEQKRNIRFDPIKNCAFGFPVGNIEMSQQDIVRNIVAGIEYTAYRLRKGWTNIKTIHIKTSMGKPVRLY